MVRYSWCWLPGITFQFFWMAALESWVVFQCISVRFPFVCYSLGCLFSSCFFSHLRLIDSLRFPFAGFADVYLLFCICCRWSTFLHLILIILPPLGPAIKGFLLSANSNGGCGKDKRRPGFWGTELLEPWSIPKLLQIHVYYISKQITFLGFKSQTPAKKVEPECFSHSFLGLRRSDCNNFTKTRTRCLIW